MPGRREAPALGVLRAFAAARLAANGVRATAREIGIQPFGLQGFIDGSKPHTATLRKLEEWYLRTAGNEDALPRGDAELVAVEVLIRGVPEWKRAEALERTAAFLGHLYDSMGVARPSWLKDISGS